METKKNKFEYDEFQYNDYKESDAVTSAGKNKTDAENALKNYGDFSYGNQATLDGIMDKIMNREEFSYDLNGDALYQQYKDKYIQQGKMAMQDTMGQAAAMTGGYGNSYAASVGNQAYQASLQNLNDIVPELYQMAYDKYLQEEQSLYNKYGMLSDDRNTQYGMWSDGYNRLAGDRDYYASNYDSERSYDYNKYANERDFAYGTYSDDKSYAYNEHRNAIADEQWQKQFDEAVRMNDLTEEQWEWQKSQNSSSNGGGGTPIVDDKGNPVLDDDGKPKTTGDIPEEIINGLSNYKTNTAKADYLAGWVAMGKITEPEAKALLAEHGSMTPDFKDRTWTVVSKGGGNLWGVDNNAKVKDQYGNTYRLDDLVDKLVKEGMSKKQATNYVKKLQQDLGISKNWMFGW